ncbi:DNA-binding transcriptional MerR regulator [Rhodococcus sp. PvR099]|nr:DNA-binding transcriptional MerR regulator [Rhodococcus sp. PvR099]
MMLTVGELASLAGTTVKTVRHYHARGLLVEPPREANGYRRYGAQDLVQLSRIRRLRDLGLSIAQIGDLLDGETGGIHQALDALDDELAEQSRLIALRRRTIADLRGSLDPELPDEFAKVMSEYLAAGVSPEWVAQEKEFLLLVLAVSAGSPDVSERLLSIHRRVLAQPHRARGVDLIGRVSRLGDDAGAAEIEALATDYCAFMAEVLPDQMRPSEVPYIRDDERMAALMDEHRFNNASSGYARFVRAVAARLADGA